MFEKQPWMQRAGEYPRTDKDYFALLARAVLSAGLGPKVVESRWERMTDAFHQWEPSAVANMEESEVARLLSDPGIIRNRRKIEAVIQNAGLFQEVVRRERSFHAYLEGMGARSDLERVAAELSKVFTHLGPTSALFFLFSAGWRQPAQSESEGTVGELVPIATAGQPV